MNDREPFAKGAFFEKAVNEENRIRVNRYLILYIIADKIMVFIL